MEWDYRWELEPRNTRNARKMVHEWVYTNEGDVCGFSRTRMCVHGCDVFQEHELALIDTNAYVMGIWNHERNRNKN